MFTSATRSQRLAIYGILVLCAILIGLIETTQNYLRAELQSRAFSWRIGLVDALPSWIVLASLIPAVVAVARRARLDRPVPGGAIATHMAAALLFALTHESVMAVIMSWRWDDMNRFSLYFWKMVTGYLALDVVVYWGMVGGYYALDYARELRRREVAASQLTASLSEARLQALRAQLNPHFLFNTLNAISVLAMKGDSARVTRTLSLLSDLLRLTIDGLPQEVPLAQELELTDRYLEIQRVRFPDRLRVEREISPEVEDAMVPSLVLQPIVENAVLHGVARQVEGGWITLRARRRGEHLELQVSDTGPGFKRSVGQEGIGLTNTRARLEQLYGDSQRVTCENNAHGACVSILLPFRPAVIVEEAVWAG
ncbi:MAG TPA: histidine kinase [Vicinamibacterales bacterium]|nr:histidine kinase [Vicinamibacterales bacterium]